jgi:ribosomal protein S4
MFCPVFCELSLKKKLIFCFYSQKFLFSSRVLSQKPVLNLKTQHTRTRNINFKLKKTKTFFKFDRVVCKRARWTYNSKNFRNILNLRNRVNQYFDGVFSNSYFKKELKTQYLYLDYIRYSFIKPEFRLDIILWRLNFFSSPYSARIAILKNKVLVNNQFLRFSYYLQEGDVVSIQKINNLKFVRSLRFSKFALNSFVEVDYYSNTFIVLQDYSSMSVDTFPCVIRQSFKASTFLSYLRLK